MAKVTAVDGNRVTLDDVVYEVVPAGTAQFYIVNEFGDKLGYFTVRGKTVNPEDYRLTGAPPVIRIARLWAKVHLLQEEETKLVTKGFCQIALHESASEEDLSRA